MNAKKLAVVTGTRAEYGLLRPVLQKLAQSPAFALQLLVTGAHLSAEYGNTVTEIEQDGLPIAARIPILKFGHGPTATAQTIAFAIEQFAAWFEQNRPSAVLVLGDRYEIFAVAVAAAAQKIPLAHISGGDVTLGAADDYYRHCITQMACLHFPSCADSAARLLRLGCPPETVFNVGGLGDENIRTMEKLSREELAESLQTTLSGPYALVTFHPETAGEVSPLAQMDELLAAMEATPGLQWLITKANADAGGEKINARIDEWVAQNTDKAMAFTNLGVQRYLSAMKYASLVAGNSSSGVVETPTFGLPTVNIGNRQAGRLICENVICCPADRDAIAAAFDRALSADFTAMAHSTQSPYNGGDTSGRIVELLAQKLAEPDFGAPKPFYDGE